jgi:hypothetical protein
MHCVIEPGPESSQINLRRCQQNCAECTKPLHFLALGQRLPTLSLQTRALASDITLYSIHGGNRYRKGWNWKLCEKGLTFRAAKDVTYGNSVSVGSSGMSCLGSWSPADSGFSFMEEKMGRNVVSESRSLICASNFAGIAFPTEIFV